MEQSQSSATDANRVGGINVSQPMETDGHAPFPNFTGSGNVSTGHGKWGGIGRRVLVKFILIILIQVFVVASCFQIRLGYYSRASRNPSSPWIAYKTTCPGVAGSCLLLQTFRDDEEDLTFVIPRCATGEPVVTGTTSGQHIDDESGSYVSIVFPGCPSDETIVTRVTD